MSATTICANYETFSDSDLHVIGNSNVVRGGNCKVTGNYNHIASANTTVIGDANIVSGIFSRVFGNKNIVSGKGTHVEGNDNKVSGDQSTVRGNYNRLTGNDSHAIGHHNALKGRNCTARGRFNDITHPLSPSSESAPPLRLVDTSYPSSGDTVMATSPQVSPGPTLISREIRVGTENVAIVDTVNVPPQGVDQSPNQTNLMNRFNGDPHLQLQFLVNETARENLITGSKHHSSTRKCIDCPSPAEEVHDRKATQGASVCVICHDNVPVCVALPCRHMAYCVTCARVMCKRPGKTKCAKCRVPIKEILRLFME